MLRFSRLRLAHVLRYALPAVFTAFIVALLAGAWTDPMSAPPGGNVLPPVRVGPSSAQPDPSTNESVWLNKTGASGNLLRLEQNGVLEFLVDAANDIIDVGTTGDEKQIIHVKTPTAGSDAATKGYVDAQSGGGDYTLDLGGWTLCSLLKSLSPNYVGTQTGCTIPASATQIVLWVDNESGGFVPSETGASLYRNWGTTSLGVIDSNSETMSSLGAVVVERWSGSSEKTFSLTSYDCNAYVQGNGVFGLQDNSSSGLSFDNCVGGVFYR